MGRELEIKTTQLRGGACRAEAGGNTVEIDRHPVYTMNRDDAVATIKELLKAAGQ